MLSSDEVSAILRRAAELEDERDVAAGLPADRIDLASVEQATGEVGISAESVRRAYAELQVGGLPPEAVVDGRHVEILGPATVAEQRVIRLAPEQARERLGRILREQTFELRRSTATTSLWRRRKDLSASARRALDFSKKIKLTDARAITVNLTEVADPAAGRATLVRLEADIGQIKTTTAATTVAVPTGLAVVAAGVGAITGAAPVVAAAAVAWVPVTVGAVGLGRVLYRREYLKVGELLAMFLDRLEGG